MDCAKCGERASQGDAFCARCGTPLYGERSGRALAGGTTAATTVPSGITTWRPVSERESRFWAVGAHVSALVGGFMGGIPAFLGPLIVWLVRKDEDAFAAAHARAAFNFHLSVIVYAVVLIVLTLITFGLGALLTVPVAVALGIGWLVFTIVATLRAANDRLYRYPFSIPFLR